MSAPPTTPLSPAAGSTWTLQASRGDIAYDAGLVARAADVVTTYHAPDAPSVERITKLREAAREFLVQLVANAPSCPERSTAIAKVREALMWGNAAIALKGK